MKREKPKALTMMSGATALVTLIMFFWSFTFSKDSTSGETFMFVIVWIIQLILLCKCNYREAWCSIWLTLGVSIVFLGTSPNIGYSIGTLLILLFVSGAIAIWKSMVEAARRAAEAAGEAIEWVVNKFVDLFTLKNEVKRKCPNALKMLILEKKRNAVEVGIFNRQYAQKPDEVVNIETTEGISSDIVVGQEYVLTN